LRTLLYNKFLIKITFAMTIDMF